MNKTLDALRCGKRAEGYRVFSEACLLGEKEHYGYPVDLYPAGRPLYRARIDKGQMLSRRGMFHIPFEDRHKVASRRYSVPGLPCLYFGESLFCCWKELGSPALDELHFSRFSTTNTQLNIVDMNFNLGDLANHGDRLDPGFIIWWPLLAACSMERKHDERASFHEEYLIPQLFTEFISNRSDVDGIRYFSCREDVHARMTATSNRINELFINLAVPSKTLASKGFCPFLLERFHLTDPISWQVTHAALTNTFGYDPLPDPGMVFRITENVNHRYDHTFFYQMERFSTGREIGSTMGPLR